MSDNPDTFILITWNYEHDAVNVDMNIDEHPERSPWEMMYSMIASAIYDTAIHRVRGFEADGRDGLDTDLSYQVFGVLHNIGWDLVNRLYLDEHEFGDMNEERVANRMKDIDRRRNLELVEAENDES